MQDHGEVRIENPDNPSRVIESLFTDLSHTQQKTVDLLVENSL